MRGGQEGRAEGKGVNKGRDSVGLTAHAFRKEAQATEYRQQGPSGGGRCVGGAGRGWREGLGWGSVGLTSHA